MQELLDLAHSKLKENSKSYDDLLELTMKLCKDYKKLAEFGQTNFPEVTGEQPQIDYSVLKKFEKNANLYQKSLKLNLIK
jgi:N6-adenosine-specific RNA methylase IME4